MAYIEPKTKFNPGNESFKVDLEIKEPRYLKPDTNNEVRKEAFIFLVLLVIFIIFGYFLIKFLT